MLLPNAARAQIDNRKLAEYCLDSAHPVGRHKAVVFRRALGITASESFLLRTFLLEGVLEHEATPGLLDDFGQRYTVDILITTTVGSATVRSAWMLRVGEDFPRLTTCYVLST